MSRTHSLTRPQAPVVLQARGVSHEIDGTITTTPPDGTLLLVTHDRAMLDSVTVTRTIRLPLP